MFRAILCSSSGGQNCISTASGIVTLYERPVESGIQCLDFSSFIFIFHLRVHFSILCRCVCKFAEAVMEFEWFDRMAVSSANVLRAVFGDRGMSAV
jgi:hypothetical protein